MLPLEAGERGIGCGTAQPWPSCPAPEQVPHRASPSNAVETVWEKCTSDPSPLA